MEGSEVKLTPPETLATIEIGDAFQKAKDSMGQQTEPIVGHGYVQILHLKRIYETREVPPGWQNMYRQVLRKAFGSNFAEEAIRRNDRVFEELQRMKQNFPGVTLPDIDHETFAALQSARPHPKGE